MKPPHRDIGDLLRQERSRGRRRPVDVAAQREHREREEAVLEIFRHGTEDDLRQLLRIWDYPEDEIEQKIRAFRAARRER